ncbi:MAG: hypothetical protein R3E56_08155 [Burkholderiaceae bacterium]
MSTKQMRLAVVAVLVLVQSLLCAPLALAETREALFRCGER